MSQFENETAVTRVAEGRWSGTLSRAWNIGENPNGGYLASVVLAAVRQAVTHPDPITVTTHYLRPGVAGAACDVTVDVLRAGRSLSTVRASLVQEGKERLAVLAAYGDLTAPAGVATELTVEPPAIPAPDACVQRSGGAQGVHLPIGERLDVRLHPDLARPGSAARAQVAGWIRFRDGREPDAAALPLFADTFPPSPFALLGVVGWVPTVELTVHVRRRPAPGWIQTQFTTEDLQQGRMIESGLLWDSEGNLVAQSRQIGLVMRQG
ncbi:MAG: thioesterase family protein [Pseudomonadales bacterium]